MANYYFLGTRLPALSVTLPPEITFEELDTLMRENLKAKDYAKTLVIRRYADIENIRAYWLHEELDPFGTMDFVELEEALLTHVGFPKYVYEYMDKYPKREDQLRHFPELISSYFRHEFKNADGFLKECLNFEREWRLVLVGFRAKKLERDIIKEMQFEDVEDPMVHQLIAQKDSKTYHPPDKYAELKAIFEKYQDEPLALHLALSEYRFNKIEQMLGFDLFSIDRILGYMIQLIIVEKYQRLDKQKGQEIVDNIIKEAT